MIFSGRFGGDGGGGFFLRAGDFCHFVCVCLRFCACVCFVLITT